MNRIGDRGDGAAGPYLGFEGTIEVQVGGATIGVDLVGLGSGNTAKGTTGVSLDDSGNLGIVTYYDANGFAYKTGLEVSGAIEASLGGDLTAELGRATVNQDEISFESDLLGEQRITREGLESGAFATGLAT